jgi:hypothetical protein
MTVTAYTFRHAVGLLNAAAPQRAATPPSTPRSATATPSAGSITTSGRPGSPCPGAAAANAPKAVVVRLHAVPAYSPPTDVLCADRQVAADASAKVAALLAQHSDAASVLREVSIVVSIASSSQGACDAGQHSTPPFIPAEVAVRAGDAVAAIIAALGRQPQKEKGAVIASAVRVARVAAEGCRFTGAMACAFLSRVASSPGLLPGEQPALVIDTVDLRSNLLSVADLSKLMRHLLALGNDGQWALPFKRLQLRENPGATNPAGCRVCELYSEQAGRFACDIDVVEDVACASSLVDGAERVDCVSLFSSSAECSRAASISTTTACGRGAAGTRSASHSLAPSPQRDTTLLPQPHGAPPCQSREYNGEEVQLPSTPRDRRSPPRSPIAVTLDASGACLPLLAGVDTAALERQHVILSEQWHRAFFTELGHARSLAATVAHWARSVGDRGAADTAVLRRVCAARPRGHVAAAGTGGGPATFVPSSAADGPTMRLLLGLEDTLRDGIAGCGKQAATVVADCHAKFTNRDVAHAVRRCDLLLAAHDYFCVTADMLPFSDAIAAMTSTVALSTVLPPSETPSRVAARTHADLNSSTAALAAGTPRTMRHRDAGTPTRPAAPGEEDASACHEATEAAALRSTVMAASHALEDGRSREARELKVYWNTLQEAHTAWREDESSRLREPSAGGPGGVPTFALRLRCELLKALVAFRAQLSKHEAVLVDMGRVVSLFAADFAIHAARHKRLQSLNAKRRLPAAVAPRHHTVTDESAMFDPATTTDDDGGPQPRKNVPRQATRSSSAGTSSRRAVPAPLKRSTSTHSTSVTPSSSALCRTPSRTAGGAKTPTRVVPSATAPATLLDTMSHKHSAATSGGSSCSQPGIAPTAPALGGEVAVCDATVVPECTEEERLAAKAAAAAAARRVTDRRRKEHEDEARRELERKREAHAYTERQAKRVGGSSTAAGAPSSTTCLSQGTTKMHAAPAHVRGTEVNHHLDHKQPHSVAAAATLRNGLARGAQHREPFACEEPDPTPPPAVKHRPAPSIYTQQPPSTSSSSPPAGGRYHSVSVSPFSDHGHPEGVNHPHLVRDGAQHLRPLGSSASRRRLEWAIDDSGDDEPCPGSYQQRQHHTRGGMVDAPRSGGIVPNAAACRRRAPASPQRLRTVAPATANAQANTNAAKNDVASRQFASTAALPEPSRAEMHRRTESNSAPTGRAVELENAPATARDRQLKSGEVPLERAHASAGSRLIHHPSVAQPPHHRYNPLIPTSTTTSTTDAVLERLSQTNPDLYRSVAKRLEATEAEIQAKVRERMASLVASLPSGATGKFRPATPNRAEWC